MNTYLLLQLRWEYLLNDAAWSTTQPSLFIWLVWHDANDLRFAVSHKHWASPYRGLYRRNRVAGLSVVVMQHYNDFCFQWMYSVLVFFQCVKALGDRCIMKIMSEKRTIVIESAE